MRKLFLALLLLYLIAIHIVPYVGRARCMRRMR
jgi:hypothetical protein